MIKKVILGNTLDLYCIRATLGTFDGVVIFESPDEETLAAVGLALGAMGNVRTQTMRALSLDEMNTVLGKLP